MEPLPDYNELWREAVEAKGRSRLEDPGSLWDLRAKSYDRDVHASGGASDEIRLIPVLPGDTVLDVGAGTGRLTLPLSHIARSVTAVDASKGMLEILQSHLEEENITNVSCVHARWEDLTPGIGIDPHDIVISSHAIGFSDLKRELAKFDAAAKRSVHIIWHAGDWRDPEERDLFKAVFGEDDIRSAGYPDYLWVVHILHDMAIYANVTIFRTERSTRYDSPEEAATHWMASYEVPPGAMENVRGHFERNLLPSGDGGYIQHRRRTLAMIWWEKD